MSTVDSRPDETRTGYSNPPEPFWVDASDGQPIRGFLWRRTAAARSRPVVIINSATSVLCQYYFRFAEYLAANDFNVIVYDYRGIGLSRPHSLRGFDASWLDWGSRDFEAVLRFARKSFPDESISVVAHSVGGFLLGLAGSNSQVSRAITVGAQYAYWRDYAPGAKGKMLLKWHLLMPLATILFGYFPGKRLGWLEDTPKGVVRDWIFSRPKFEDTWRGVAGSRYPDKEALVQQFAKIEAPILAIDVEDDEFGTPQAIERLHAYFTSSEITRFRISPRAIGEQSIGHFGFFNRRFASTLWPIALRWLNSEDSWRNVDSSDR